MIRKLLPILLLLFIWLIFSKPYFFDNKIPYSADFQVSQYNLWNTYSYFWQPIKNPAMPDLTDQLMPWKHFTIEQYKKGELPLWNSNSFSGTPHMANYQSAIFSFTNIFYFLMDFNKAWGLSIIIQPLLAGIFMFLYIRSLKLSNPAALLASISFMFCGFITVWMSWGTLSLAISFLPLALFAIEKYSSKKLDRYLLLLSLTIPLSFFSGHFQISLYFAGFIILYIFFKLYEDRNYKNFIKFISFYILGIVLSLIQIIPSFEFYKYAPRSGLFQKIDAIPFIRIPTIIAPDFYGNPVTRNAFLGNYGEWNFFAGVIPLLLGIYAIFSKNKKVVFFFITALGSLLLCLDSPFADLLIKLKIPVISTSSLSRIVCLFSFSIAVLSAFGLDFLIKNIQNKNYKLILPLIIIGFLIFGLLGILIFGNLIDTRFTAIAFKNLILPSLLFSGLLFSIIISLIKPSLIKFSVLIIILLTAFDMLRFSTKWEPFTPTDLAFAQTPIIEKLQTLDNTYRFHGPFGAEGSVYYNLPSTEGYDPLYINRYGELLGSISNKDAIITPSDRVGVTLPTSSKYMPNFFDLFGIKYILLKRTDRYTVWAFPFKKYDLNKFKLIYKEKDYFIFENKTVYPRAFLVGDYTVIKDDQKIINNILDRNFNLRNKVVLEKNPQLKPITDFSGAAKIISYKPNKIIIKTDSNEDSILFLSDNYYPGWHAKVNGKEIEIYRANYTFKAISVPKGINNIEFYYSPLSFKLGATLSLGGMILICLILAFKWYTGSKWNYKTATHATK